MKNLFNDLMALCNDDEEKTPFYYSVQEMNNDRYAIFSYRFTDRDSWIKKNALESRGVMFQVDENDEFIRIASRPMQKFFNLGEDVEGIDYDKPAYVMDKADGSLISSYCTSDGALKLKSKGSLHSDHAIAAMAYLDDNLDLKNFITTMEINGCTVNMEFVSPEPKFRIVVYYEKPELIVLNVRNRVTGEYLDRSEYADIVKSVDVLDTSVLDNIEDDTLIEGYVVVCENGNWYKQKCPWYLLRHRSKDIVNQPNAFVEIVLKEEADDVFDLMLDQPEVHKQMLDSQKKVINKANTIIANVTDYYNSNKDLSRKDYAIKGQVELNGYEFALAMMYFIKQVEPNWKDFFIDKIKKIDWGLDLEEKEEE